MYMRKVRMDVVIVSLIVGGIVALSLFCNVKSEGFKSRGGTPISPSGLQYSMSEGVPGVVQQKVNMHPAGCSNWFAPLASNTSGRHVPLGEDELAVFSNNAQSPLCCPSTYSGSTGCVCATEEQMKYLNARGGNRVANTLF